MHGVIGGAFHRVKSYAQTVYGRSVFHGGIGSRYVLRVGVLIAAHIGVFRHVAVLMQGIAAHVQLFGVGKRLHMDGVCAGRSYARKRLRRRYGVAVLVLLRADVIHVAALALLVCDVKVVSVGVLHGGPGERLRLPVERKARGGIQLAGVIAGGERRERTQRQSQDYYQCQNFLSHYSSRIITCVMRKHTLLIS